ncbi:hypothetical protein IGI04_024539 [Brassica rapa subsp. trilocularis]|uniref:Uncharacterized protein n=1 Tax=Brassica rapa subsp. trilocularis TaxID=1813537 RepID=A0ABQ7M701_BRACM|nr:hypothetical protein IGI04_024539 [Brassica rapa subsp. trilocularis]
MKKRRRRASCGRPGRGASCLPGVTELEGEALVTQDEEKISRGVHLIEGSSFSEQRVIEQTFNEQSQL